ncbi:MAG: T9SS type A sorting domain-containing protein [Flavobacteriales bacterium]|nr:T9SS type A sorting domain-containing protein [Flavobacteriales bacterium]
MKRFFVLLPALFFTLSVFAQQNLDRCATDVSLKHRLQVNPSLQNRMMQAEQRASHWSNRQGGRSLRSGIITIPVVVHLVYNPNTAGSNIPDSLIFSQIDILNEDFRRLNANAVNTRSIFDTIAADIGVQFCLASVDPNGNPTTGIERISSTASHALTPFNNSVKSTATGGADPWPPTDYLNLWICDMSFFGTPLVLGYAQFPGDDPATDGVVIQYQYIGLTNDPATAPANLGRTTSHEVGHWLGLRHIWGDGDCSMDDLVWDTPNADAQSNFDCDTTKNTCDDLGNPFWAGMNPPDMVENFMDYSSDSCMNMFTLGQSDRIWSFLSTDRLSLFSSNGCGIPTLNAYATLTHNSCQGDCGGIGIVTPVSGVAPFTFEWDDPNTQTDSMAVYLCEGVYHCKIKDANNDSIIVTVNIYDPNPLVAYNNVIGNATCSNCADGSAAIQVSGGTPPLTYSLNGGAAQTDSLFSGLNPGTYSVMIMDACGEMINTSITIGNSVSVFETEFNSSISIYPNPAEDLFMISFASVHQSKIITVYDAIGNKVYSESVNGNVSTIDVSQWSNGVYVINVSIAGYQFNRRLIVK